MNGWIRRSDTGFVSSRRLIRSSANLSLIAWCLWHEAEAPDSRSHRDHLRREGKT